MRDYAQDHDNYLRLTFRNVPPPPSPSCRLIGWGYELILAVLSVFVLFKIILVFFTNIFRSSLIFHKHVISFGLAMTRVTSHTHTYPIHREDSYLETMCSLNAPLCIKYHVCQSQCPFKEDMNCYFIHCAIL